MLRMCMIVAAAALTVTPAAADPARLQGREWRVLTVSGERPPAAARIGIAFLPEGRIAGRSGCNRFTGRAEIGAGTISVGPLAGTRMACPPPLMAAESRFLGVLQDVRSYALQRGRLVLRSADGRTIEARRAPRQR